MGGAYCCPSPRIVDYQEYFEDLQDPKFVRENSVKRVFDWIRLNEDHADRMHEELVKLQNLKENVDSMLLEEENLMLLGKMSDSLSESDNSPREYKRHSWSPNLLVDTLKNVSPTGEAGEHSTPSVKQQSVSSPNMVEESSDLPLHFSPFGSQPTPRRKARSLLDCRTLKEADGRHFEYESEKSVDILWGTGYDLTNVTAEDFLRLEVLFTQATLETFELLQSLDANLEIPQNGIESLITNDASYVIVANPKNIYDPWSLHPSTPDISKNTSTPPSVGSPV